MQMKLLSKHRRPRDTALSAALIAMLCALSCAQNIVSHDQVQRTNPIVNWETYDRVLDALFPRDDADTSKTIFEFVLRFEPSFHATSQIVIRKRVDKVQVVEYTSPDGNVFDKLNETLGRGGKEDPVEMAKSIRIIRREIPVSDARIRRWFDGLFDSLVVTENAVRHRGNQADKVRTLTLPLDGTTYNLWYKQGLNKISLSLYDVEVDTPGSDGELKLVQWMNSVRREVAKSK